MNFRLNQLTSALIAICLTPNVTFANEDENYVEVIEVKGFRGSIFKALNEKRTSDTVVDAISADDMGALPDASIADALTRMPGVTAVRTGGQASGLNIRGLDGSFIQTTLNGREQVTTGGKREIQFDQYPSELINQAQVYKSQKASLIEGGVAGTVELQTVNPLDKEQDHNFSYNIRGSYNDRASQVSDADEYGRRISFAYQGKFLEETLGFSLGYAHLYQPSVANQFVGLRFNDGKATIDGKEVNISEGFELQQKGGQETRDGYMASLHYLPNDNWKIVGDFFYSKFDSETFSRGFRVKHLKNGDIVDPIITQGSDSYSMTGGTVNSIPGQNFSIFNINDNGSTFSKLTNAGLNIEWNDGDRWLVGFDIALSKADGEFVNGGTRAVIYDDFANQTRRAESVSYRLNRLNPASVSMTESYTNLNTLGLKQVGMWPYNQQNELYSAKFDASYQFDLNYLSSIEFGVRYADRSYQAQRSQAGYGNEFDNNNSNQPVLQLTPNMAKTVNFSGELGGYPDFTAIDFQQAVALVNQQNAVNGQPPFMPTQNWENNWTMIQSGGVKEKTISGYLQANLDFEWGDTPVTGNIGVRVINSDQSSDGLQQVGPGKGVAIADGKGVISDEYLPILRGKKYTDVLPSINLNFMITDDSQIRFAAASVMARPPINKMKAGMGSWYSPDCGDTPIDSNTQRCYNAWGNTSPLLDPMYADQIDLSYEYYFGDGSGAATVALFYKNIKSFIENKTERNFDFTQAGIYVPDTITQNGQEYQVVKKGGQYQTAYNNTKGGYIQGVELALTHTFDYLPSFLSNLGYNGSYSYSDSEVKYSTDLSGGNRLIPLPGLSKHVFNSTLFYADGGFDTRLSARYRSSYVGEQVAVEPQLTYFEAETILDYQASYSFDNGLKALFQVNNLTDEPNKTYFGEPQQTGTIQYFGRQYYFGVNHAF
ncbi:TonB-dependent receptor [Paraferrimonas sp. SM1919]|uniref:TonB-dependent receptor n=1 Tax=Paraferrimonas sp. SM1919 TaxID=2662263 RepID=UPI001F09D99B|nr:TonB-dependent receptor [Paraferrimonas sp. SM1919]